MIGIATISFLYIVTFFTIFHQLGCDDIVDPNSPVSLQRGMFTILKHQLELQQLQLKIQQQQLQLQSELLKTASNNPSVLRDLIWWSCILTLCYYSAVFFKKYGFGVVVCLLMHWCNRKHPRGQTVRVKPEMPQPVVSSLDTFNKTDLHPLPTTSFKAFGVRYGTQTTTV